MRSENMILNQVLDTPSHEDRAALESMIKRGHEHNVRAVLEELGWDGSEYSQNIVAKVLRRV